MPKILVKQAFNVLMSLSHRLTFEKGVHDVSDDVAAHWWVQAHAERIDGEEPALTPDPEGEAAKAQAEADAKAAAEKASAEKAEADAQKAEPTPSIDEMSDDQLRELIKARDGRYPHSATGRDKLLAAAKGDKAVSDEIEQAPEGEAAKA